MLRPILCVLNVYAIFDRVEFECPSHCSNTSIILPAKFSGGKLLQLSLARLFFPEVEIVWNWDKQNDNFHVKKGCIL